MLKGKIKLANELCMHNNNKPTAFFPTVRIEMYQTDEYYVICIIHRSCDLLTKLTIINIAD